MPHVSAAPIGPMDDNMEQSGIKAAARSPPPFGQFIEFV
jgi:hypothetical protein